MQKQFKVIRAFGLYSVGAKISPTGVYRSQLLAGKWIEPVISSLGIEIKADAAKFSEGVDRARANIEAATAAVAETAALPAPARRGRPRKTH